MLKALLRFLNKGLTGRTWEVEATHAFFGNMVLFAFRDSDESYWECEIDFEGRTISIGLNAPDKAEPTERHVEFVRRILSDPDATFARTGRLLVQEYEKWQGESFPPDWRTAFEFVGMAVPAGLNEDDNWELTYESRVDPNRHQFTCYFEYGRPAYVSIDG